MGIDISQWRARIGCFTQPLKIKLHIQTIKVKNVSFVIRLLLFLLLVVQGIEMNPGPGPGPNDARGRGQPRGRGSNRGLDSRRPDTYYDRRVTRTFSRNMRDAASRSTSRSRQSRTNQQELATWFEEISNAQEETQIQTQVSNRSDQILPHDSQLPDEQSNEQSEPEQTQSDPETDTEYEIDPNDIDTDLEGESNLKTILLDIRKDVKQINHKFDNMKKSIKDLKQSNKKLQRQNDNLTQTVSELKTQVHNLERVAQKNNEATERLEAQSRRSNLIIYGIEGDKNESWEASEDKFRHYISDELKVPEYNIRTERVHRLNTNSSPAPIIVKFSFFQDREKVLKAYREKRKAERQTGTTEEGQDSNNYVEPIKTVRVGEDFPARVRNVRKKLWPFLRKCISEQKNAYIKYDKLIVDDNIYVYDYAKKAPVLVSK